MWLYHDLIQLRRNWYVNTRGLSGQHLSVYHTNNEDKVIAFHRWHEGGPGDDVVVVVNFANRPLESYPIGLPQPGMWRVRFNSDLQAYDASFGDHQALDVEAVAEPADGLPYQGVISMGPYTAVIFSQD